MYWKKAAKFLKRPWVLVCLLVLCINLVTLTLDLLGLREELGWIPYRIHTVESGSMEPVLSRGDLILIRKVPYSTLAVGDDVTFIGAEGLVSHRIVNVSGDRFITQGLANTMADQTTLGPENYCGKVIASLPVVGWLLRLFDSSVSMLLLAALVLLIGLGQPLLERWFPEQTGEEKRASVKKVSLSARGICCAAVISILISMPTMTEAKYVTQLKRYETAVALPMYFSSNYLSEDINTYNIQGWAGTPYYLTLKIRNSDNSLLFNGPGINLNYGVGIKMLEGSNPDYSVTLTRKYDEGETETAVAFDYPPTWTGFLNKMAYTMEGASAGQEHSYEIAIQYAGNDKPKSPDVVKFAVYACTAWKETYYQQLEGVFQLQVAEENSFLGERSLSTSGSMVRLSITTNLVTGGGADGEQLVAFRWNPEKLYLNEYERTAFNATHSSSGRYDRGQGLLYMRLQPYSKVELEFFKKQADVDIADFGVAKVETFTDIPPYFTESGSSGNEDGSGSGGDGSSGSGGEGNTGSGGEGNTGSGGEENT